MSDGQTSSISTSSVPDAVAEISDDVSLECKRELVSKRDYLFRGIPEKVRNLIVIDDVSSFSVTESTCADKMSLIIARSCGGYSDSLTILDGMACVGGNTISFSRRFRKVLTCELDDLRFSMLQHNSRKVLGLKNVTLINGSVLEVALAEVYDILFLDPEWGGPDYRHEQSLRLTISEEPLEDFCMRVMESKPALKVIALKLPVNYDYPHLEQCVELHGYQYTLHTELTKMTLAILRRR